MNKFCKIYWFYYSLYSKVLASILADLLYDTLLLSGVVCPHPTFAKLFCIRSQKKNPKI